MNAPVELKLELNPQPEFQLPIQNYHEFYRFYLTEHRNKSLLKSKQVFITKPS